MRSAVVEEEKRAFWSLTGGQKVYLKVKFLVDWLVALVALVVLSPVFAVIVLAIKREDGGPVFFTQKRVARGGVYFPIYKFRTMRLDTPHDMPTHLLKDPEQYITRVGRFLRRTSLDELPQLWNIIRGSWRCPVHGPPCGTSMTSLPCGRSMAYSRFAPVLRAGHRSTGGMSWRLTKRPHWTPIISGIWGL